MSNKLTKNTTSRLSESQVIQRVYNEADATLSTSSFITSKVGNKIDIAVNDEIETYSFYDGNVLLYVLTLTYTDDTRTQILSVERTA